MQFWEYGQSIQLFQERLSEKQEHATIAKGIVRSFNNFSISEEYEKVARDATDVCFGVLKASKTHSLTAIVSGDVPFGIVAWTFYRQPFSTQCRHNFIVGFTA